jgi:hypothetical protein
MGLNVDNLFIKTTNRDGILSVLPRVMPKGKWKVAVSNLKGGWLQLIDSHEKTPPTVAEKLSRELRCKVVCAQLYETSGDVGWHVFDDGSTIESRMTDKTEDIIVALRKQGISATPLMFREIVGNPDWKSNQPMQLAVIGAAAMGLRGQDARG